MGLGGGGKCCTLPTFEGGAQKGQGLSERALPLPDGSESARALVGQGHCPGVAILGGGFATGLWSMGRSTLYLTGANIL